VNLEALHLARNRITALPDGIRKLVNLRDLLLIGNPVAQNTKLMDSWREALANTVITWK
jgi:Leucine-rich repeat (LRR) protein